MIVNHFYNNKNEVEYLTRCKGYGAKEDTWEPESNLDYDNNLPCGSIGIAQKYSTNSKIIITLIFQIQITVLMISQIEEGIL